MKINISESSVFDSLFDPIIKKIDALAKTTIKEYIGESLKLKKNNRRLYFLKFLRYRLYKNHGLSGCSQIDKDGHLFQTEKSINDVFLGLLHPYELSIAAIDAFDFENKQIDQVIEAFAELSEISTKDSLIAIQDDDIIQKSYDDGFYWVKINQPFCTKEGRAMGHCGNEPSKKDGDRIFSLRKKVRARGRMWWEKYCTIIQDYGKFLGEIRGRFNQEPDKNLFDHIVDLLSDRHMFTGIMPASTHVSDTWSTFIHLNQKQADKLSKNGKLVKAIQDKLKVQYTTSKSAVTVYNDGTESVIEDYGQLYLVRTGILVNGKDNILFVNNGIAQPSLGCLEKIKRETLSAAIKYCLKNFEIQNISDDFRLLCKVTLQNSEINKFYKKFPILKSDYYAALESYVFKYINSYTAMEIESFTGYKFVPPIKCIHNLHLLGHPKIELSLPKYLTVNLLIAEGGNLSCIPDTWDVKDVELGEYAQVSQKLLLIALDNQKVGNRIAAASNEFADTAVLLKALSDKDVKVRLCAVQNKNAGQAVLENAIIDDAPSVRDTAFESDNADESFLMHALDSDNSKVRLAVIRCEKATAKVLSKARKDPNFFNQLQAKMRYSKTDEDRA